MKNIPIFSVGLSFDYLVDDHWMNRQSLFVYCPPLKNADEFDADFIMERTIEQDLGITYENTAAFLAVLNWDKDPDMLAQYDIRKHVGLSILCVVNDALFERYKRESIEEAKKWESLF